MPHILFFTLWALLGDAVYTALTDDYQDTTKVEWGWILVAIGCLLLFMQRWAAMERRRTNGKIMAPTRLRYGLLWHHPRSFPGLVSNSLLVFSAIELVLMLFSASATSSAYSAPVGVWPNWQRVVTTAIAASSLPIAYFWSRSEFLIASRIIRPLTPREIARRALDLDFPERAISAAVLLLLTIWCFILALDARDVGRLAAFPDGSIGTVGLGEAWFVFALMFLLYGVIPWIIVYRGLPIMFTDLAFSPEGGWNAVD